MKTSINSTDWLNRWREPSAEDRPLQIIHNIALQGIKSDGASEVASPPEIQRAAFAAMQIYRDLGLGGVVCNVDFKDYMRSETHFQTLIAGVEACAQLGLVVWLYDEDGYPSGAAGGLVLVENPAFEATELAFDEGRDDPFIIRPAYEHTHASNNYYAARRYINLLDDKAVGSFISHTHEVYWQHLKRHFGCTIQAVFTDEPSLMAINLGQLREDFRRRVRIVNPIDLDARALPAVPWSQDLAERYRQRYGEDMATCRRSLFDGDAPKDRQVRGRFWALVADLVAERYFGAIQDWCGRHHIASSGHILCEEAPMCHPALYGNPLKCLSKMDIPGLDMLSSDPESVVQEGWLTAALPGSAALLTGRRRVMTEVSDFNQKLADLGPVSLNEMKATAAWQAAWGVTDFTLYYGILDRPNNEYRAYCDYVGRLTAILKPAIPAPDVLLYYPVYDLWAEYKPAGEPLRLESQSSRAQQIVRSFLKLGRVMQRIQLPFTLIDHEFLAAATPTSHGTLEVGNGRFSTLILPAGVVLPPAEASSVEAFRAGGGRVLTDEEDAVSSQLERTLIEAVQPSYCLYPPDQHIALGKFVRDDRVILLVANVGRNAYTGCLSVDDTGIWHLLDPESGAIDKAACNGKRCIHLSLAARQAILLVNNR